MHEFGILVLTQRSDYERASFSMILYLHQRHYRQNYKL